MPRALPILYKATGPCVIVYPRQGEVNRNYVSPEAFQMVFYPQSIASVSLVVPAAGDEGVPAVRFPAKVKVPGLEAGTFTTKRLTGGPRTLQKQYLNITSNATPRI